MLSFLGWMLVLFVLGLRYCFWLRVTLVLGGLLVLGVPLARAQPSASSSSRTARSTPACRTCHAWSTRLRRTRQLRERSEALDDETQPPCGARRLSLTRQTQASSMRPMWAPPARVLPEARHGAGRGGARYQPLPS
jgi:hypothetical protein